MKKILVILFALLLVGCQSPKPQKTTATKQEKSHLVCKEWTYLFWNGDTTEKGYYFIKDESESSHISYYDYALKQEVYLCNKPECQHKDDTCTAYLEFPSTLYQIFAYGDHLYMIESMGSSMNALGESEKKGPAIIQMDLDGQNRKVLYRLDDGLEFERTSFALADAKLYIPITKSENIEIKKNQTMQVNTKKYLYAIDLNDGTAQKVVDMKYKDILGVDGRNLIMSAMSYSEDPQKLLDEKNYQKYDQLMMKAKVNYEVYNIDNKETKTIEVKQNECGKYYQNKIYFINKTELFALDLKTAKTTKMIDLPKGSTYSLSLIINDYVIIEEWKDNYVRSYKIAVEKPKLEKLAQYTRAPKEPVQILAKTKDQLLVIYDREGQEEKTWAGTMQYEISKEYIGLISIDDFFNNKKNYQPIKTLTKKRQA